MRLISTTLAGPGTAPIIGDALRSVAGLVTGAVVIRSNIDDGAWDDLLLSLPTDRVAVLALCRFEWCADFAAARNTSLDFAAERPGAEWAILLDPDERVRCPSPDAVHAFLADLPPEVCVVVAFAADGATARERLFRLPARHRWHGRTHEAFPVDPGEQATIPPSLIVWDDVPKTAEQLRAKNERDVGMLAEEIAEHPDDGRWRFYLGAALVGLDRHEEAVDAYRAAADLGGGEDAAMACVRAAEILCNLKRYEEAVAACARGMTMRADIAELPWLAAGASWNMGDRNQAEAFALLAKVHGERGAGRGALTRRVGFRVPRALREGPDEILRLVRPPVTLTASTEPIHITVTSTGIRAEEWAPRCIESVFRQTANGRHVYVAADESTMSAARPWLGEPIVNGIGRSLLANLLPIWRSLPDDEVIVWLDGDDWLPTDSALATVAEMHAAGAWATYGQFIRSDGVLGFCEPVVGAPRFAAWTASHLKTFRAGLVKRIRDEDLRRADGEYLDLAIDQAIMLPILEMAAERAVFCDRILAVYNSAHSFAASASAEERAREETEVMRIRAFRRYARIAALDSTLPYMTR